MLSHIERHQQNIRPLRRRPLRADQLHKQPQGGQGTRRDHEHPRTRRNVAAGSHEWPRDLPRGLLQHYDQEGLLISTELIIPPLPSIAPKCTQKVSTISHSIHRLAQIREHLHCYLHGCHEDCVEYRPGLQEEPGQDPHAQAICLTTQALCQPVLAHIWVF